MLITLKIYLFSASFCCASCCMSCSFCSSFILRFTFKILKRIRLRYHGISGKLNTDTMVSVTRFQPAKEEDIKLDPPSPSLMQLPLLPLLHLQLHRELLYSNAPERRIHTAQQHSTWININIAHLASCADRCASNSLLNRSSNAAFKAFSALNCCAVKLS